MDLLGRRKPDCPPLSGAVYLSTLHKYLRANLSRLAPNRPADAGVLAQTYTLFTLGLDPSSAPLSRNLKVPLTLGFGTPSQPKGPPPRPIPLRISPDRLLYLLLRWQSLPQALPHVGRTDVPIPAGLVLAARGEMEGGDSETQSIRSWVPSMRSVSLGSADVGGWFRKEEVNEDGLLLGLYEIFTVLPALQLHPPKFSEKPIAELIDAGGYTSLGGIDVRVPLDVLRNLQILELDGYDPRGLLIPLSHHLRSLTVRDVSDGDDWIEELVTIPSDPPTEHPPPRFPNLRYLSIRKTNLLSLPSLPLSHLAHLDLSHNLLDSLPSSLASLSSLVTLNLSHNCITSLRNAPSTLGNISTLNLAYNQIDCLVGLERVLGLQRVDVRNNQLPEVSEVGRLGVLPGIKEIWCANNHFDREGTREDWRVELGVSLAMEGREVLVDDTPWSWNEKRRIDAGLAARGHQAGRRDHEHTHRHAEAIRNTHGGTPGPSRPPAPKATPTQAAATPSPSTSPVNAAQAQKKRRPRRVIQLDSEVEVSKADANGGGLKPLRLADRQSQGEGSAEGSGESGGEVEEIKIRSKGSNRQRSKLSAQSFEPSEALDQMSPDSPTDGRA